MFCYCFIYIYFLHLVVIHHILLKLQAVCKKGVKKKRKEKAPHFRYFYATVLCNKLEAEVQRISIGQYPLQFLRYPYTRAHGGVRILKQRLISSAIPVYSHSTPRCQQRWNLPDKQRRGLHRIKDSPQMVLLTGWALHQCPMTDFNHCFALPEDFGSWISFFDLLEVNHRSSIIGWKFAPLDFFLAEMRPASSSLALITVCLQGFYWRDSEADLYAFAAVAEPRPRRPPEVIPCTLINPVFAWNVPWLSPQPSPRGVGLILLLLWVYYIFSRSFKYECPRGFDFQHK